MGNGRQSAVKRPERRGLRHGIATVKASGDGAVSPAPKHESLPEMTAFDAFGNEVSHETLASGWIELQFLAGRNAMKLDAKALALACAILWGAAVMVVALVNLALGGYGQHFLELLSSFYPGYHATHSIGQVILVTIYAFFDGLIGGLVFGWLYNRFVKTAR